MSCFIGQPLALDAPERDLRPLGVVNAKADAGVLPEIELCQITVKVALIDMLIDTDHAAFEDRKEAFEGVGIDMSKKAERSIKAKRIRNARS